MTDAAARAGDPPGDVFHVAVLVDDLDEAIERYGRTLGLTFGARQDRCLSVGTSGAPDVDTNLSLVYSHQGPPYIELMQATADTGVWGKHRSPGFHHIGAWVDDLDGRLAELAAEGTRAEATLGMSGKVIAVYLEPDDLSGVRLELCSRPAGPWSPPR